MRFATLKFFFACSILISIAACGGKSKPDRKDQPVPPNEVITPAVPAVPTEASATPVDPTIDPNADVGTSSAAGAVAYESTLSKTPKTPTDEVPYAEQNTEYVGDVAQQVLDQKNGSKEKIAEKSQVKKSSTKKVVEAEKVLGWLKNGNTRFVKRRVRADGQSAADRARLLKGQNPHAIVFTCSDSRVPPELIFDQKLGEIYVVRNDQLAVSADVLASLEKGASLGAQLLVVLSYDGCSSDAIKSSGGITSQSTVLAELENSGKLKIQPAAYDLKTGVVKFE